MSFHNSKKVIIDNHCFDSRIEGEYYKYLKDLKEKNIIGDFGLQPSYLLLPKFERNGEKFREMYYIADFLVVNLDGTSFVVDVKGMPTEQSKIKRKLFCHKYDMPMKRLVRYKGERIDYFDNKKRIARDKKDKLGGAKIQL